MTFSFSGEFFKLFLSSFANSHISSIYHHRGLKWQEKPQNKWRQITENNNVVSFLTLKAQIFLYKPCILKCFFQFEIFINVFVGSSWFIWIPMLWVHGCIITLRMPDRLLMSKSDVYRRQISTTKVDPRAVRVKGIRSLKESDWSCRAVNALR